MARPRTFNVEEALRLATELFWSKGYFHTSTRDIVDGLRLGRQSIYNAFGDKEALFDRCIRYYEAAMLADRFANLESKTAGRQEIVRFLAQTVDFLDSQPNNRSCMISIVAAGASHHLPTAAKALIRYHKRLNTAFSHALSNAAGDLKQSSSLNPSVLARGLSCTVHGMAVVSKQGATRDELVDVASTALQPLY